MGLGWASDDAFAFVPPCASCNLDDAEFEIDLAPTEGDELSLTHSGLHREMHEQLHLWRLGCRKELPHFRDVQDAHGPPRPFGRADCINGVSAKQLPPDGLLQAATQHRVVLLYGPGGEPRFEPGAVRALDVGWTEVRQTERTESRYEMPFDD